ncbi:MAG: hypothetical protein ACYDAC_09315 [Candidatus Dormibacteria bacterium]
MTQPVTVDEEYLLVEEVADRLGLPLALLLRRVEAGDIPARRIENENGVHYSLRLSDLGIEDASPAQSGDALEAAFGGAAEEPEEHELSVVDLTGRRVDGEHEDGDDGREPAQPAPPWLHDAEADDHEVAAPVPAAIIAEQRSPQGDLSAMSLDARELVAGLLDRWERTLEQRIYTEQRQRFQGELAARQNMVKQLQMELHTVRAEHAAAQAQKDRQLAEKERELADRDRQLSEARRLAEETERLLAPAASARRRRWFWQREI